MPKNAFFLTTLLGFLLSNAVLSTQLEFNGEPVRVYFNDGDTFKILSGKNQGTSCRVNGVNALESYGPVHQWGTWHPAELYDNAKAAMLEARRGNWHCTSDMKQDTYGRLLASCADLSKDLLSKGLAHVMTVDATPAERTMIRVQQTAIRNGIGMWEKGVPAYILTSVHSSEEEGLKNKAYNRFVSTADGHSRVVQHKYAYPTCGYVTSMLADLESSALVYVPFEERYGDNRASCLR